jgi:hypothetical protein
LSQTTGPTQCGTYTFGISSAALNFVVQNGATITFSPTLETFTQIYEITATSTMVDLPKLSATTTITVTVTKCRVLTLEPLALIPD